MLVLALQADPLLSPQSTACLGSPMSVSSCSRLDATTFAFDLSTLDLLMVLRGMCYAGVVMLPCGILNPDSLLPVLDSLSLGALLLLRSFSRMGSFPPIPGCSHSDIPLFLHSLFHPGLSSLLFGSVHLELSLPSSRFFCTGGIHFNPLLVTSRSRVFIKGNGTVRFPPVHVRLCTLWQLTFCACFFAARTFSIFHRHLRLWRRCVSFGSFNLRCIFACASSWSIGFYDIIVWSVWAGVVVFTA